MKKKKIIAWSIFVGVILSVILICATVFTLKKVDCVLTSYITQSNRSRLFADGKSREDVNDSINKSAGFNIGGNLLFMKFDANIDKIEKANPFVRVERIVRSFPNKITIYYSEREAVGLLSVKDVENAYLVVDEDLKVLDQTTNTGKYNLPVIDYFGQGFTQKPGDFIGGALKGYVKNFVDGAFSANANKDALYEDVMKKTSKIIIKNMEQNNPQVVLEYYSTALNDKTIKVEVIDANKKLYDKIAQSWKIVNEEINKNPQTDKNLRVEQNSSGKIMITDKATSAQL